MTTAIAVVFFVLGPCQSARLAYFALVSAEVLVYPAFRIRIHIGRSL